MLYCMKMLIPTLHYIRSRFRGYAVRPSPLKHMFLSNGMTAMVSELPHMVVVFVAIGRKVLINPGGCGMSMRVIMRMIIALPIIMIKIMTMDYPALRTMIICSKHGADLIRGDIAHTPYAAVISQSRSALRRSRPHLHMIIAITLSCRKLMGMTSPVCMINIATMTMVIFVRMRPVFGVLCLHLKNGNKQKRYQKEKEFQGFHGSSFSCDVQL